MLMRRLAALALAGVLALVLLAGCGQKPAEQGSSSSQSAQAEAFYSFTDDSGREVSLESQPMPRPGCWPAAYRWVLPRT